MKGKTHKTETAKTRRLNQLEEIVDCGVNPATPLRKENAPIFGRSGLSLRIPNEHSLVIAEMLEDQSCQVSVLSEVEQVLRVKSVNAIFRVLIHDRCSDEERSMRIGRAI
mgnify:CR=1 FL=1|jgi:hypothetical protein